MKRVANLYPRIPEPDNLRLAFVKAARGKRGRPDVVAFSARFDANIETLRRQILARQPDIGHYRFFRVRDPKPRDICAAAFPERVLHHAVMNVCEPHLEAPAIFDSYACRKGKGNRAALARAQTFARHFPWFLKLDIRKYFDSIDHAILMNQLARRFKDRDLLDLFRRLLATYCTAPGKGMPIGNLISQHLANFHLGTADHFVKEERRVRGYLRYMDDMVLFGPDKAFLKTEQSALIGFLESRLALRVKDNVQLNRTRHGIPFLGFRVFPQRIQLSPAAKRRFIRRFRNFEQKFLEGRWTETELARHAVPLVEFTRAGNAGAFRRNVIQRFGASL